MLNLRGKLMVLVGIAMLPLFCLLVLESASRYSLAFHTTGLAGESAVQDARHEIAIILAVALLAFGIAISVVGWLAELRVLQPMRHLAATASRLSRGELDARVDLDKIPMKEMHIFATTFNGMANSLQQLALVDGLTGISNRRQFDRSIGSEVVRANRMNGGLALLMIDVDSFKAFNDHYGHDAGDGCLRRIAATLRATLQRPTDLAARYGGEEFAVLLPDTDEQGALVVANAIRAAVRGSAIPHENSASGIVTVSIGVAALPSTPSADVKTLIERADRALYAAKESGRDRIVVSDEAANAEAFGGAPKNENA
ncbi:MULTISPECIES: GGDEF domain-containing protein [unclassified Acidisoma]|jgi:diguanylate cyclase (GGDEF)-like protein|uniref:GGDEF domain-containing protein n=1 Tax=unclassified Acidisoma TaxID=2634065 RepID=UPI00131AC7CA|nr:MULTISPECIES: GGDEF domain-containing protein [unclassified Acidisoma]